jgi:hypothetical protein
MWNKSAGTLAVLLTFSFAGFVVFSGFYQATGNRLFSALLALDHSC